MARKAAPVVAVPQDALLTTLERVALADVRPHPRNYQDHPEAEIQHLMQSLLTHGVYKNVVIAREGTLLAGHGVVEAARRLGYTHLTMKRTEYDPDEPRALHLLVADNEIARTVLKNEELLAATLQDLSRDDPLALLGTGYDAAMLEAMLAGLDVAMQPPPVQAPEAFPEYTEDIPVEHTCPRCGYEWSGGEP